MAATLDELAAFKSPKDKGSNNNNSPDDDDSSIDPPLETQLPTAHAPAGTEEEQEKIDFLDAEEDALLRNIAAAAHSVVAKQPARDAMKASKSSATATAPTRLTDDPLEIPAPEKGFVIDRVNDLMEFEISHILLEAENRPAHFESLLYFWKLHPAQNLRYGRRYARLLMAQTMTLTCGAPPYPDAKKGGAAEEEPDNYFYLGQWGRQEWRDMLDDLVQLRAVLLRSDARRNYAGGVTEEVDQAAAAATLDDVAELQLFREDGKYQLLMDMTMVQAAMAPIRDMLRKHVVPDDDSLADVLDFGKTIQIDRPRDAVMHLFVTDSLETDKPKLVAWDVMDNLLGGSAYDLPKYQERMEKLMISIDEELYPGYLPHMVKIRYRILENCSLDRNLTQKEIAAKNKARGQKSSPKQSHVPDLTVARGKLRDAVGEDPLEECLAEAQKAGPVQAGHPLHDEEEEEEEEDVAGSGSGQKRQVQVQKSETPASSAKIRKKPRLSMPVDLDRDDEEEDEPVPRRRRVPILSHYDVPPEEGVFDEHGHVTRRRRWTQEEKDCVKAGVHRCGKGQWAAIKKEYGEILRNRTTVQIKDCYRTMAKQGEV